MRGSKASEIDSVPCLSAPEEKQHQRRQMAIVGRSDPFLGLMEPQLVGISLKRHYRELARSLSVSARKLPANHRLLFPAQLAESAQYEVRATAQFGEGLVRTGNKKRLKVLVEGDLKTLRVEVDRLCGSVIARCGWIPISPLDGK